MLVYSDIHSICELSIGKNSIFAKLQRTLQIHMVFFNHGKLSPHMPESFKIGHDHDDSISMHLGKTDIICCAGLKYSAV